MSRAGLTDAEIAHRRAIAARDDLTRAEQAALVPMSRRGWCTFLAAYGLLKSRGPGVRMVECEACRAVVYRYVPMADGSRIYIDPAIWHDCPRLGRVTLDYGDTVAA